MWHHHIQYNRLRGSLAHQSQRCGAAGGTVHDDPMACQIALEEVDERLVVVDEQDRRCLRRGQQNLCRPIVGRFFEHEPAILRRNERLCHLQRHTLTPLWWSCMAARLSDGSEVPAHRHAHDPLCLTGRYLQRRAIGQHVQAIAEQVEQRLAQQGAVGQHGRYGAGQGNVDGHAALLEAGNQQPADALHDGGQEHCIELHCLRQALQFDFGQFAP